MLTPERDSDIEFTITPDETVEEGAAVKMGPLTSPPVPISMPCGHSAFNIEFVNRSGEAIYTACEICGERTEIGSLC